MKKISLFFSFLLIFTFFFVGSSYAAKNDLPPLPTIDKANYDLIAYKNNLGEEAVFLIYDENGTDLILSMFLESDTKFRINCINTYSIDEYIRNGDTWEYSRTLPPNTGTNVYFADIYYSTYDIYDTDKITLFFPQTPIPVTPATPTLEETLAEEIPATAEKITQTMKTILLCGVGCLVLLISLPLFGKVFRIFQVK